RRHAPGYPRGRSCHTEHKSGNRLQPSLSRVTPPAVSERFSELIGCPISRSLAASCVCLELRPLPSTGVTQLHRYYEPLRHPNAPGLSLAGVRLAVPGHAMGLPVLRALSLCTCCRHYPGAAAGRRLRSFAQPYQPSPVRRPGRPAHRPFRGLHGVHLRCGLHTRAATNSWHAIRRLQPFRYLHDCSGCFRRERVRRVGLSPTGKRRLVTAHVECGHGRHFRAQPLYIRQRNLLTEVLAMWMCDPGGTPSTVSFDPEPSWAIGDQHCCTE